MSDKIDLVKLRKNFYRDSYYKASSALLMALVIVILLCMMVVYFYMVQPSPDFYATSVDGKLTPLNSMDTPNYSNKPLIE